MKNQITLVSMINHSEKEDDHTLPPINSKDLFAKARNTINKLEKFNQNIPFRKENVFEKLNKKLNDEKKKTIRILNEIHIKNTSEKNERSDVDNWKMINAKLNEINHKIDYTSRDKYNYNNKCKTKQGTTNQRKKEKYKSHIKLVMIDLYKAFVNQNLENNYSSVNANNYEHQIALTETNVSALRIRPINYKKRNNNKLMLHSKRD